MKNAINTNDYVWQQVLEYHPLFSCMWRVVDFVKRRSQYSCSISDTPSYLGKLPLRTDIPCQDPVKLKGAL